MIIDTGITMKTVGIKMANKKKVGTTPTLKNSSTADPKAPKVFYRKEGRKYIPVASYDTDLYKALEPGDHLVHIEKSLSWTQKNVTPSYAPLIAAAKNASKKLTKTLVEAASLHSGLDDFTPEQQIAWNEFKYTLGDKGQLLKWQSANQTVAVMIDAMIKEVDEMLKIPAVKLAFDHFITVSELTKEK